MKSKTILIGLLGTIGSGKTTVSDYLVKRGFARSVMGDLVREKAARKGMAATRHNLQQLQEIYRKQYGKDFFIKEAIRRLRKSGKKFMLIDGIRTPLDAAEAKRQGAVLVLVDANKKVRFARLKKRARAGDERKTFSDFLKDEKNEWKLFQFRKTIEHVDYHVDNSEDIAQLRRQIDALLKRLAQKDT